MLLIVGMFIGGFAGFIFGVIMAAASQMEEEEE